MLIFSNGYMEYYTDEGDAVLDENGNPVGVDSSGSGSGSASGSGSGIASDSIEVLCNIETLTADRRGRYDDGRYSNATYAVMLDAESVPLDFSPLKVRLVHERKGDLGVFTVQRIEYYTLTQSIELWV